MATVTKPIALDESLHTTEQTPRNLADVLAEELSAIITAIGGLNFINFKVVAELPTTGISTTTIYLVPSDDPQSENTYDEYINLNGTVSGWEKIGSTDIDLSGYYTSAEVDALLADKADVSDIPTVNDGTLTIQQNGETKGTFTANQSGNSTVNIEIPTTDIQTAVDEFETYNGGLLSECKVALEPIQDLHGYDHPWVGGAEKNKFNGADVTTTNTNNWDVSWDSATNTLTIEHKNTYSSGIPYVDLSLTADTYVVSGNLTNSFDVYKDGAWMATLITGRTFVVESGHSYAFYFPNAEASTATYGNLQLELGSIATAYESYSNNCPISGHTEVDVDVSDGDTTQEQVTVNLGGTYYSGTLDVVTGVMNVDKVGVDLGSLSWTRITTNVFRAINSGMKVVEDSEVGDIICEIYKAGDYTGLPAGSIAIRLGEQIWVRDTTVDDLTLFENQVNGKKFVYPLATPQTIQLSPTIVKALVGENHLSAPLDGQEITESKYKKMFTFDDIIAYIQSLS